MKPLDHNRAFAEIWPDKKCVKCGRNYPLTVLNFDGHMHHGTGYTCLDTKTCERLVRKAKRKKK
jgi:hypothetical protein